MALDQTHEGNVIATKMAVSPASGVAQPELVLADPYKGKVSGRYLLCSSLFPFPFPDHFTHHR